MARIGGRTNERTENLPIPMRGRFPKRGLNERKRGGGITKLDELMNVACSMHSTFGLSEIHSEKFSESRLCATAFGQLLVSGRTLKALSINFHGEVKNLPQK